MLRLLCKGKLRMWSLVVCSIGKGLRLILVCLGGFSREGKNWGKFRMAHK